jgi:superfamily II DNA/RNA helicase
LSFENLKLDPKLLAAVVACHYKEPTDIQSQAIPVVLEGRDLMASAQTGTGKTAAFVLPAMQKLLTPATAKGRGPRVLVLTPTRELALQVTENIKQFGRECKFVSGSVVGGMSYGPQINLLSRPLDLLVATPGRLMDHMEAGRVDFSRVEMLVLDEADRMLDMGFVDAVKKIAGATPSSRQTLLFSATLEGQVLKIAQQLLKSPVRIALATNSDNHASITQQVHVADDAAHKHSLLVHLLSNDGLYQAVIFTATKRGADRLAKKLVEQGHGAAALHGDMNQNQRKRAIDRMKRGEHRVLVATDVAARGLDITGVSHVINFDLPRVPEDYIHRIGRTGRGGATGIAISLVGPDDRGNLRGIERLIGRRLEPQTIPGLEPKRPVSSYAHDSPRTGQRPGGHKPHGGRPGGRPSSGGRPQGQGKPGQRAQGTGRSDFGHKPKRAGQAQSPRQSSGEANGNTHNRVPRNADPFKRRDRSTPRADYARPERDGYTARPATKPAHQPKIEHKRRGWSDRMKALLG